MFLARVLLALALCSTMGAAGVTMELRGENPVVLVGNSEHFTDYGETSHGLSRLACYHGTLIPCPPPSDARTDC